MEDNFDQLLGWVVAGAGMLFFWVLTSFVKPKKERKKSRGPLEANTPQGEPLISTTHIEEEEEQMSAAATPSFTASTFEELEEQKIEEEADRNLTFIDLLEQFTNPKAYYERISEERKRREIERKAEEENVFKPEDIGFGEPMPKSVLNSIKIKEHKPKRKKPINYKKLFSNPNSIHQSIIIKEVLDRKYF